MVNGYKTLLIIALKMSVTLHGYKTKNLGTVLFIVDKKLKLIGIYFNVSCNHKYICTL
jgi:hypothetical protein